MRALAGVRKHCRKSHPEWLREVDLDKANHGCRWAAYCTREPIADGDNSLRSPTVGSKRARDSLGGQGSALPPTEGSVPNPMKPTNPAAAVPRRLPESAGDDVVDPRPARITVEHKPRHAPHGVAMDGKSALVPLRYPSSRENLMPPVRRAPAKRRLCCLAASLWPERGHATLIHPMIL